MKYKKDQFRLCKNELLYGVCDVCGSECDEEAYEELTLMGNNKCPHCEGFMQPVWEFSNDVCEICGKPFVEDGVAEDGYVLIGNSEVCICKSCYKKM